MNIWNVYKGGPFPVKKWYKKGGAHNLERVTPILGVCHGVFTEHFFRHLLGYFFRENRISAMSMSAFEV